MKSRQREGKIETAERCKRYQLCEYKLLVLNRVFQFDSDQLRLIGGTVWARHLSNFRKR